MKFLFSVFLISFLVFFFGCKTSTDDEPTVSSSTSQPLEELEEQVRQEKPQTIIVPTGSLGNISDVRKKMLEKTLESALDDHFDIVPKDLFEEAQEKAFEELEYEECTEERCIILIQEMLQVENVFHLQVIGEGNDTQLSLSWRTLDEKKKETDICLGCGTFQLNDKVGGLVDEIIGVKEEVVAKPLVVETQKVVPKIVKKEPVIQKTKNGKTEGVFVTVGEYGNILTSSDGIDWTEITSGSTFTLNGVTAIR